MGTRTNVLGLIMVVAGVLALLTTVFGHVPTGTAFLISMASGGLITIGGLILFSNWNDSL